MQLKAVQILIVLAIIFSGVNSYAQTYTTEKTTNKKVQKMISDCKGMVMEGRLEECIKVLNKAIGEDPVCIDLYEMKSYILFEQKQFKEVVTVLEKIVELNPDYKSKIYYMLTWAYWKTDAYDKLNRVADRYLASKDAYAPWVGEVKVLKINAAFAAEAVKHPVPFNPVNLGDSINTKRYNEYSPSVNADNTILIFNRTVLREGFNKYSTRADSLQEDFYISKSSGNNWNKALDAGTTLNTLNNEGAQKISADGNILYFTICDKPGAFGSCDIYTARKNGDGWADIKNVGFPISMQTWDSQPSISADGKDLYFASSGRPGSIGGKDIFVSHKGADGKWGIPENLGPVINTPYEEGYPFIHPDNQTLYFSSSGHPGMGEIDIYVSRKGPDGKWGTPVNLGYPINTKGDDNGLIVSIDGKTAYYSSTPAGRTDLDLYKFDLPENVRPVPTTYVKGIVTDKANGKPLVAEVQLTDLATRKVVATVQTAVNGSFLESLPSGNNYALSISKPGYLFHSENFSVKEPANVLNPFVLNIELVPIVVNNSVVLKNVFFEVNQSMLKDESKVELDKLIAFLNSNSKVKIEISGHTDNTGTEATNQTLSQDRAKAVYAYLIAAKVDASRLSYKGYGSSKPIADNNTDEGKAQNRRTEFKITALQ